VKYAWIEGHRLSYPVTMMCELLSVSRSGLNAARQRGPSKRASEEEGLVKQIRAAQHKHRGRYGRRRMSSEVSEAQGRAVNHKRVARLMREHGLSMCNWIMCSMAITPGARRGVSRLCRGGWTWPAPA
jgi:hypothetical protein